MSASHFERTFAASTVDAETGCRIWAGRLDRDGYANYSGKGAYRLAYSRFVGPIPDGMTVDHLCFNITCVEPSHLRLLTNLANARNRANRRQIVPDDECVHGHRFDDLNTYVKPNGERQCRACARVNSRAYRARRAGRAA